MVWPLKRAAQLYCMNFTTVNVGGTPNASSFAGAQALAASQRRSRASHLPRTRARRAKAVVMEARGLSGTGKRKRVSCL